MFAWELRASSARRTRLSRGGIGSVDTFVHKRDLQCRGVGKGSIPAALAAGRAALLRMRLSRNVQQNLTRACPKGHY